MQAHSSSSSATSAAPTPNFSQRIALTSAISDQAEVMLIDADNGNGGRASLPEAVSSGASYAVKVKDHILAIDLDLDRTDRSEEYRLILDRLQDLGMPHVEVASGREGHRHLFANVGNRTARDRLARVIRRAGLDVRSGSALIRPPGSPHRSGLAVQILNLTPDQALEALLTSAKPAAVKTLTGNLERRWPDAGRADPIQEPTQDWAAPLKPLSATSRELLEVGKPQGERSEAIWVVMLDAANKDYPAEEITRIVRYSALGSKPASKRDPIAWLHAEYRRAQAYVKANPAIKDTTDWTIWAYDVLRAADSYPEHWKGRAGISDRRVLQAHVKLASAARSNEYHVSIRQLAEFTGLREQTVCHANRRLAAKGWVSRLIEGKLRLKTSKNPSTGSLYRLNPLPPNPVSIPRATEVKGQAGRGATATPGGCEENQCAGSGQPLVDHGPLSDPSHDVWRAKGLGPIWRSWTILSADDGLTVSQLVTVSGLSRATVYRHLKVLSEQGLARKDADGHWFRIQASLDLVAANLGVAGMGWRIKQWHRRQRQAGQDHFRRWAGQRNRERSQASHEAYLMTLALQREKDKAA